MTHKNQNEVSNLRKKRAEKEQKKQLDFESFKQELLSELVNIRYELDDFRNNNKAKPLLYNFTHTNMGCSVLLIVFLLNYYLFAL